MNNTVTVSVMKEKEQTIGYLSFISFIFWNPFSIHYYLLVKSVTCTISSIAAKTLSCWSTVRVIFLYFLSFPKNFYNYIKRDLSIFKHYFLINHAVKARNVSRSHIWWNNSRRSWQSTSIWWVYVHSYKFKTKQNVVCVRRCFVMIKYMSFS